uniref:Uncharacterized protein DDB_G0283697-like isoform X2 n=1 Tax=Crassostrea virginica TaxID=6565 RepID=A0A8B8EZC4_CRAVI|nr:uncharacterized protein DDB_G0283697-like isoform X2 [Crassostrea virginica]
MKQKAKKEKVKKEQINKREKGSKNGKVKNTSNQKSASVNDVKKKKRKSKVISSDDDDEDDEDNGNADGVRNIVSDSDSEEDMPLSVHRKQSASSDKDSSVKSKTEVQELNQDHSSGDEKEELLMRMAVIVIMRMMNCQHYLHQRKMTRLVRTPIPHLALIVMIQQRMLHLNPRNRNPLLQLKRTLKKGKVRGMVMKRRDSG